jgi:hypothetical protein
MEQTKLLWTVDETYHCKNMEQTRKKEGTQVDRVIQLWPGSNLGGRRKIPSPSDISYLPHASYAKRQVSRIPYSPYVQTDLRPIPPSFRDFELDNNVSFHS